MKILLHSPVSTVRRNGNRQTASEWVTMLQEAGHEVNSISHYEGESADLLIALHATKSREALLGFREAIPDGRIILALTGTDIYPAATADGIDSMRKADLLITLQRKAIAAVPEDCRNKVHTIIQSARQLAAPAENGDDQFDVCVVGHLREVKDPLLTARASRLLPPSSKIRVLHAGGILDESYAARVAEEEKRNPRYTWLGELSESETANLIASSKLLSLTSLSEGGARVVGEAIVHHTPVVSTRIDGVAGLLGDDYPGFFPVADADALADLLTRCEDDPEFYESLKANALAHREQFSPARESAALLGVIEKLTTLPSADQS